MAMNEEERDNLLLEMHGRLRVIEAYIVGNGVEGLVKRVMRLEAWQNRVVGGVALALVLGGIAIKLL